MRRVVALLLPLCALAARHHHDVFEYKLLPNGHVDIPDIDAPDSVRVRVDADLDGLCNA
jgi:hypothetical protein